MLLVSLLLQALCKDLPWAWEMLNPRSVRPVILHSTFFLMLNFAHRVLWHWLLFCKVEINFKSPCFMQTIWLNSQLFSLAGFACESKHVMNSWIPSAFKYILGDSLDWYWKLDIFDLKWWSYDLIPYIVMMKLEINSTMRQELNGD